MDLADLYEILFVFSHAVMANHFSLSLIYRGGGAGDLLTAGGATVMLSVVGGTVVWAACETTVWAGAAVAVVADATVGDVSSSSVCLILGVFEGASLDLLLRLRERTSINEPSFGESSDSEEEEDETEEDGGDSVSIAAAVPMAGDAGSRGRAVVGARWGCGGRIVIAPKCWAIYA